MWWRWLRWKAWWRSVPLRFRLAHDDARLNAAIARGDVHIGGARDVYALLAEAAGDDLEGWEQIGDGTWTRPVADGIRGVVGTQQLGGHSRQLCWGLSLAWVPHITSSGTSLHRTAKSARLDLYVEGQFHGARISQHVTRELAAIYITSDVERAWRNAHDAAERLFARATGAEAVLALAEEQMEDERAMTVHMPGPVYVATFTLAHLGREEEARAMLDRQLRKWYLHPDAPQVRERSAEKMERALERIMKA